MYFKWLMVYICTVTSIYGNNTTSLEMEINRITPGNSNPAVRLWSLYLPHKIPGWMYTDVIDCGTFLECSVYIGRTIGFDLSPHTTIGAVYVGPAMITHLGVLNTTIDRLWWATPYDLMSNPPVVQLGATSIRVIDNTTNRMCPCKSSRETCTFMSPLLPMRCVPSLDETGYDDLYLVSAFFIVCVIVGTLMLIIRDFTDRY
jgi:hypothetical protein